MLQLPFLVQVKGVGKTDDLCGSEPAFIILTIDILEFFV